MSISVVHLSLIQKNSILGVSQKTFSLEIGMLFIFIFLKVYVIILLLPIIHILLKKLYLKDEAFFEIYTEYSKELDFWDPWDHEKND
jgi:type IV secretory pathway VirB3-like protein